MQLTEKMCEFIGSIIGDGNIYDKKPWWVEMTGHPILDKEYYQYLCKLINEELNYLPKIFFRYGAIRFRVNKKKFVDWLKYIGIPAGKNKFKNVLIPNCILKSKKKSLNCLRGIFDTDGSVHFEKRQIYKQPYIRIELHMKNLELLKQIANLLRKYGLHPTISKAKPALYLNGYKYVGEFIKKVGFKNKRHINRVRKIYPELVPR